MLYSWVSLEGDGDAIVKELRETHVVKSYLGYGPVRFTLRTVKSEELERKIAKIAWNELKLTTPQVEDSREILALKRILAAFLRNELKIKGDVRVYSNVENEMIVYVPLIEIEDYDGWLNLYSRDTRKPHISPLEFPYETLDETDREELFTFEDSERLLPIDKTFQSFNQKNTRYCAVYLPDEAAAELVNKIGLDELIGQDLLTDNKLFWYVYPTFIQRHGKFKTLKEFEELILIDLEEKLTKQGLVLEFENTLNLEQAIFIENIVSIPGFVEEVANEFRVPILMMNEKYIYTKRDNKFTHKLNDFFNDILASSLPFVTVTGRWQEGNKSKDNMLKLRYLAMQAYIQLIKREPLYADYIYKIRVLSDFSVHVHLFNANDFDFFEKTLNDLFGNFNIINMYSLKEMETRDIVVNENLAILESIIVSGLELSEVDLKRIKLEIVDGNLHEEWEMDYDFNVEIGTVTLGYDGKYYLVNGGEMKYITNSRKADSEEREKVNLLFRKGYYMNPWMAFYYKKYGKFSVLPFTKE